MHNQVVLGEPLGRCVLCVRTTKWNLCINNNQLHNYQRLKEPTCALNINHIVHTTENHQQSHVHIRSTFNLKCPKGDHEKWYLTAITIHCYTLILTHHLNRKHWSLKPTITLVPWLHNTLTIVPPYEAQTLQSLAVSVSDTRPCQCPTRHPYYVLYFGHYRCPRVRVVSSVRVGVGAS